MQSRCVPSERRSALLFLFTAVLTAVPHRMPHAVIAPLILRLPSQHGVTRVKAARLRFESRTGRTRQADFATPSALALPRLQTLDFTASRSGPTIPVLLEFC